MELAPAGMIIRLLASSPSPSFKTLLLSRVVHIPNRIRTNACGLYIFWEIKIRMPCRFRKLCQENSKNLKIVSTILWEQNWKFQIESVIFRTPVSLVNQPTVSEILIDFLRKIFEKCRMKSESFELFPINFRFFKNSCKSRGLWIIHNRLVTSN